MVKSELGTKIDILKRVYALLGLIRVDRQNISPTIEEINLALNEARKTNNYSEALRLLELRAEGYTLKHS